MSQLVKQQLLVVSDQRGVKNLSWRRGLSSAVELTEAVNVTLTVPVVWTLPVFLR
jgi:hypothetical protein